MDEQDEKKRNIHLQTHDDVIKTQNSKPDHIPLDLILEIFSRLPVKSILRFLCVSKLWSTFTKLPSFIKLFKFQSPLKPSSLITLSDEHNELIFSYHQHPDLHRSYYPTCTNLYHLTCTNNRMYAYSKSTQGLILVSRLRIWNPSLRRLFTLPKPNENMVERKYFVLGYDPLKDKHKVLSLINEYSKDSLILTLGAQESWRKITEDCPMHYPTGVYGRCFNGIMYYDAKVYGVFGTILMSFDVNSETFNPIKLPQIQPCSSFSSKIMFYEGRLVLVQTKFLCQDIDFFILKDSSGDEWIHKRFSNVFYKREWKNCVSFSGLTVTGELIFAPMNVFESFYILYFDPKTKSIRENLLEGYTKKHPFGCRIDIFPNHIESFVSL